MVRVFFAIYMRCSIEIIYALLFYFVSTLIESRYKVDGYHV